MKILQELFKAPVFIDKDFMPTKWSQDMLLALRIYIGLKIALCSLVLIPNISSSSNNKVLQIYAICVIAYSIAQYLNTIRWEKPLKNTTFLFFFLDISLITLVASTFESISTTTPVLMYICIASASIILRLKLSIILAVFACALTLLEYELHDKVSISQHQHSLSIQLVGILFSCYFLSLLTRRARSSEIKKNIETARATALIDINHELVQNSDFGIIVIDGDGKIETCNLAAQKILGTKTVNPQDDIYEVNPLLSGLWADWMEFNETNAGKKLTIKKQNVRLTFSQLGDLGHFSKVTLHTEAALREQAHKYAIERMGRMASAIAHEIRNPLTSITTANELLKIKTDNSADSIVDNSEQLKKPIAVISRNTSRINQIIEDILTIGRSSNAEMRDIDLSIWAENFAEEYIASKIEANNTREHFIKIQKINRSAGLIAQFAETNLKQAITNLCDNALIHGENNETKPTLIKLENKNDTITLEVFSHGKPIEEALSTDIFAPFYTTATNKGGTGLGLYLCQQICELNLANISHKAYKEGNGFIITFHQPQKTTS